MRACNKQGFTLIEILLALAVIAIALTALLKVTAQNIETTNRIKEKSISHWVAIQGLTMMQLNLVQVTQNSTQATKMLGQSWYWRAAIKSTPVKGLKQVVISLSLKQAGPFREEATGYVYSP